MEVPQSTCGLVVLRRLGMRISSRSRGAGGIRGEEVLDRRELPDTLGCPGRALIVELILVRLTILGVSFGRPKTYVALRRQTRKLPGESRMLSGGAGEIHQFFSDRIVNGRPPPQRSVALFWLGSKLDNVALWESGTGPTLKNRGPSAFSTSSISRQLLERHDGISVPTAAQPVRLPQRPALVLFWATKLAESLISSSLARFGLQRGSHWRRSSEVAHRSKPERFSHPLSGSASAWFSRSCC